MNLKQILVELKKNSSKADREGMARFGINPKYALGVRIPVLRKIAKKTGKDHELALQLWNTRIHEARILASMVDEKEKVTEKQMDSWIKEFNSWDLCDGCCMNLFDKLPFAFEKAKKLAEEKQEFVKRSGFALMACLAWHDKTTSDKKFKEFFPIIIKHSYDDRNFVKKAVNWALRQIGKRNENLKKHAIKTAEQILKQESKTAKWIASDALRELRSR
jgi:3-methyladenine DNA glycosylase AlkD